MLEDFVRRAIDVRRSVAAVLLISGVTACGGYGGGGMSTPAMPTVTLAVNPMTITVGQSATLTWSTMNASTCTASGAWTGSEGTSGTKAVAPAAAGNTTYTLTCTAPAGSYGAGGTSSSSATLTVNPASAFAARNLVSDTAGGGGASTDRNLVNPWGLVFAPTATNAPAAIANNGTGTLTSYDGNSQMKTPVVQIPGAGFNPTGIVFNGVPAEFTLTVGSRSGPALLVFCGEGGMLAGWSPQVDPNNAVVVYTDQGGAVYKGLALASNGSADFLYAADFHNNKVDVFDVTFTRQPSSATRFTFVDPALPSGYAPFGLQAIRNGGNGAWQIYVAYAKQEPTMKHDNVDGAGLGLVDVFDANGRFVKQLIAAGAALNAPWGIALAPADFGTLSNALLIANFGDGRINGYDPGTGSFIGTVTDATGAAFSVPGLWGIAFGNDAANLNQPHNTLFFTAGTNGEANGVYGRIDLAH
jgi:uncharacterized protein (TIGR03118 family)